MGAVRRQNAGQDIARGRLQPASYPARPGRRHQMPRSGHSKLARLGTLLVWPFRTGHDGIACAIQLGDGKKRKNRLRRSIGPWRPRKYFAPDEWPDMCPDQAAVEPQSVLTRCFDAMDRSALYGSYVHRDITWTTHLGVAFAV